ncbi:MAG: acetolactate decarboxylase [Eubacteriales bacterium]|nr:acetolactate decarboxylase [uncultured Ruminococcus sp.]MDO4893836.1 acetolactate decarboxylase [Eubacteriales bacterium]
MIKSNKIYQVSTLQALALGYSRSVVKVRELLEHGDTGLGTFENVDGEMIVLDGVCYQAKDDGSIVRAEDAAGVPFAVAGFVKDGRSFEIDEMPDLETIKQELTLRIEENFGLNSIHIARIDGWFESIHARAGAPYRSQHVTLKNILSKTQKDFSFEGLYGTLVCVYYPDYMDGINASGWHMHFLSKDKKLGGHVFEAVMSTGECLLQKMDRIEIQLPREAAFDTYSLKQASKDDIAKVEQGKG